MTGEWIAGIAFLFLAVGGPSLAIALTWPSEGMHGPEGSAERLLVALGVPFALLVIVSELLVRTGALDTPAVWAYAITACVGSIGVVVLRRSDPELRSRIQQCRVGVFSRAAAFITLVVAASAQMSLAIRRSDSLNAPTSWYYWQLSSTIARRGSAPTRAHEWATTAPFFDYHLGFNALGSVLGIATGDAHSLVAPQLVRIFTVAGAVIGLALLARVFGAPRWAAVAAGIAVPSVAILAAKFASFRPESTAYFLMLATVGIFYCWTRARGRARLIALLICFVGVSQLHTPIATVALAICGAFAVVLLAPAWRKVVTALGVLLMLTLVALATDQVTGHRGPLSSGFATPPTLTADGSDPTYAFNQLALGHIAPSFRDLGADPPSSSDLLAKTMRQGFAAGGDAPYYIAIGLIVALGVGAIITRSRTAGRLVLAMLLALVALITAAYLTSLGWKTFVPLRTGYSRLLQVWWFIPLSILPLLPTLFRRPRARMAMTLVLVGLACVLWGYSLGPTLRQADSQPPRATLASLRRLNLPKKSVVLTNAYTQDFIRYNLGVTGLLDGRAPYLEANLLRRANKILFATGSYMAVPREHPFPFERYGVDYVLVGTAPAALGTQLAFPTDTAQLFLDPRLHLVRRGPGYLLFRVRDATR